MVVRAKGKVKQRHRMAISQYRAWLDQNRDVTHGEMFDMFNKLVDDAAQNSKREKEHAQA